MEKLAFKMKITVLWLFFALVYLVSMVLSFTWPGAIEGIMAGTWEGMQISTGLLLFLSLFWLIPLIMAFLTLVLKDSANRWTNIVLGIVFAVFTILDVVSGLTRGEEPGPALGHLPLIVSAIVVPALIAWYAWKWPKE